MTVSAINGSLFSVLSHVDGIALSTIAAINGQSKAGGGGGGPIFENRGDQLTAGDTNPIDTWLDNIGTNDFLSSGSDRATQQDNTLNSMPTAAFASKKMTLTTPPSTVTNLGFIAVIKLNGGGTHTILGGDSGPQIRIASAKINFLHGGVADLGSSSTSLTNTVWYTIGVTYDGSIVRFYLNGVADGTNSVAHTMTNPVKYLGVRDGSSEFLQGNIAHDVFFSDTPSVGEMTNGGGGKTDEMRTLWAHY